jgi:hypothetical protein
VFFRSFTLYSANVGVLVIVLSDSLCEGVGKMGDLTNSERGRVVGARLAGVSVTRAAM